MTMNWKKRPAVKNFEKTGYAVSDILSARGFKIEDHQHVLNIANYTPPAAHLMKNLDAATQIIVEAIEKDWNVVVSADPDADGVTSASIMVSYLKDKISNVTTIYSERADGHGIHTQLEFKTLHEEYSQLGVDAYKKKFLEKRLKLNSLNRSKVRKADLVLILDSSSDTVCIPHCEAIRKLGAKVIILDHHPTDVDFKGEALLVNPNHVDDTYPNKQLSGAGVVYKVLQEVDKKIDAKSANKRTRISTLPKYKMTTAEDFIDLVAVGMVGDMMAMTHLENRQIVAKGLYEVNNPALSILYEDARAGVPIARTTEAISFKIAPLINGVTRMNKLKLALNILGANKFQKAKHLIEEANKLRQQQNEEVERKYVEYSEIKKETDTAILVAAKSASKRLNGLLAQRFCQIHGKPSIVGRLFDGIFSGSYRSPSSINLKEILKKWGKTEQMGGHPNSGGFSVKEELIDEMLDFLSLETKNIKIISATEVFYDADMSMSDFEQCFKVFAKLNAVTGVDFPKISIRIRDFPLTDAKVLGKDGRTVKLSSEGQLDGIMFQVSEGIKQALLEKAFEKIEIIAEASISSYMDFRKREWVTQHQIYVKDVNIGGD